MNVDDGIEEPEEDTYYSPRKFKCVSADDPGVKAEDSSTREAGSGNGYPAEETGTTLPL